MAEHTFSHESPGLQSDVSFKKTVQPEEIVVNDPCQGLDVALPHTAPRSHCYSAPSRPLLLSRYSSVVFS